MVITPYQYTYLFLSSVTQIWKIFSVHFLPFVIIFIIRKQVSLLNFFICFQLKKWICYLFYCHYLLYQREYTVVCLKFSPLHNIKYLNVIFCREMIVKNLCITKNIIWFVWCTISAVECLLQIFYFSSIVIL